MKLIVFLNCDDDILFDFCDFTLSHLRDNYDLGPNWEIGVTTGGAISNATNFNFFEFKADLKIKGEVCEISFTNYDMKPLVDCLIIHGFLSGWHVLDAREKFYPNDVANLIGDVLGLQKVPENIKKDNPKLFISCPMNDCNSKKEVMERLQVLRRIAVYVFQKDFEFINTWIDEEPSSDVKHQRVWYAGKSLELLSEADYYLGFEKLPNKFYGCNIENYTAENLNIKSSYIAYDIFKLFSTTEINTMLDVNPHFIDPFLKVTNNGE